MLTYEEIQKDTVWIAKMQGYRQSGKYDEIKHLAEDEQCRDFDIACSLNQPEHLKSFYEAYEAQYNKPPKEKIFLLKDFYDFWIKSQ